MAGYERAARRLQRKMKAAQDAVDSDLYSDDVHNALKDALKMTEDAAEAVDSKPLDETSFKSVDDELDILAAKVSSLSISLQKVKSNSVSQNPGVGSTQPGPVTGVQNSGMSMAHFEKVKHPKFDGTVRGYISFKRKFRKWIMKRCDDELALMRLVDSCIVEGTTEWHLVKNKSTVSEAIRALDGRFGRKASVRDAVIQDVKTLHKVKGTSDAAGLRAIATALTSAQEDLKECGISDECLGDTALACVMAKIPMMIRRPMDKKILDEDLETAEAINLVVSTCNEEANAQDLHELRTSAHLGLETQGGSAGAKSFYITLEDEEVELELEESGESLITGSRFRANIKKSCTLHPKMDNHALSECREFLFRRSAKDKKEILGLHNLCCRCFEAHPTESCKVTFTCVEEGCKTPEKHNSCLHAAFCLEHCLANSVDELVSPPKDEDERVMLSNYLGHHTVRPSHVAYIKGSSGEFRKVNVLYDSGSTLSQIRQSVATECGIRCVNTLPSLRMRTAGKSQADNWGKSDLFNVSLYSGRSIGCQPSGEVHCVGVKFIGQMDKANLPESSEKFGISTDQVLESGDGCVIDILVGNNHPELFPVTIRTVDSLVLAQTPFGQIIHGVSKSSKSVSSISVCQLLESRSNQSAFLLESQDLDCVLAKVGSSAPTLELVSDSGLWPSMDLSDSMCQNRAEVKVGDSLATSPEVDLFDKWTRELDYLVCFNCDRCVSRESQLSKEDTRRLKVYRDCLSYNEEDKCFYARMPWTQNFKDIPDNKSQAIKRIKSLTKSMSNNVVLREKYIEEFEKSISEGVLVEVTPEKDKMWKDGGGRVWYVNHFGVINESSSSTPLRVVTDPTSSFRGFVINDLFEPPPNLIPQIDGLVLTFRARKIPVSMDIRRAYRTIFLEPEESHLHRLVWNRLDLEAPLKTYRMVKNNWGLRPAGALCSIAMNMIAEKFKDDFPDVYSFVTNQIYVDDGVYSVDTVEEALVLARDTAHVLKQGSFEIKYFLIGGKEVDITEAQKEKFEVPKQVKSAGVRERVLGINWFPKEDEISLNSRINFSRKRRGARSKPDLELETFESEFPAVITLRMYLSVIMSLYDVCGLVSAASAPLRHELGRIFGLGVSWDQPLPEGVPGDSSPSRVRCRELIRVLYVVSEVRFPRCLRPVNVSMDSQPNLVIFADSSQIIYGCAAYVHWKLSDGTFGSRLVSSKAKPFPKKAPLLSVARGELMGCLLVVRMKEKISKFLPYEFDRITLITDSTIALSWLSQDPYRFKTWVSCRVEEIQEKSQTSEWFHIESKLNVADLCTRGLDPNRMGLDSEWQVGMDFMKAPMDTWPVQSASEFTSDKAVDKELRIRDPRVKLKLNTGSKVTDSNLDSNVLFMDSSSSFEQTDQSILEYLLDSNLEICEQDSWHKMLRKVARTIRFAETIGRWYKSIKCPKRTTRSTNSLTEKAKAFGLMNPKEKSEFISESDLFCPTKRELELARSFWLLKAQSKITDKFAQTNAKMNPTLCKDGIWRAFGRTQSMRHTPVIIPADHPLGKVLLRLYHLPGHHGSDTTYAKASQDFWIVKGYKAANRVVTDCVMCRKLRKRTPEVSMAPVRVERLTRADPFTTVAVDFAGPYFVKSKRPNTRLNPTLESKVWVLVIVCLATGAAHLELVESYNTRDFLASLDNFIHIRGKPSKIIADLGSQIVGASGALESVWANLSQSKIENLDPMNIVWEFVPSGGHMSHGLVERMVKSFKVSMEAMTGTRKPLLDKLGLSRLLYQISDLMNDRPLAVGRTTIAKLDGDRLIRPNDLLLGRSTADVLSLVPSEEHLEFSGKSKYFEIIRRNNAFLNVFWEKWKSCVFSTLVPAEKWLKNGRALTVGDVVLIRDSNAVRNHWTLGEVHEVHESSVDGRVRKATVRYKDLLSDPKRKGWKIFVPSKSKFVVKSVRDLVVLLKSEEK